MSNYASYKPGTFTIDISNFEKAPQLFHERDMAAFIHEYCHYIQDITTISSIFGFSLWFRDLVNLINIISIAENNRIVIPLQRDIHGERINKFRSYYSLYCGDSNVVLEIDYNKNKFIKIISEVKEIKLDGNIQLLGINSIELSGLTDKFYFGLIVLQEINAFYSQQIAENNLVKFPPKVAAESLPSYPYKFGDFLFESFKINIDLETKFILTGLCLDTVQAPTVFLKVLEELNGGTFSMTDIHYLEIVIEKCRASCSYSNEDALENILPDLQIWANSYGRDELTASLKWYILKVGVAMEFKRHHSSLFFLKSLSKGWAEIAALFHIFPPPVYIDSGILSGNASYLGNADLSAYLKAEFDAASTFWAHKILFDLLCSKNLKEIDQRSECPLFEGCEIRKENDQEYSYTCKRSPWEIVKGKINALCIYGIAAHSMGLWQNDLEINTDGE